MNRRDALRYTAYLTGVAVSAPTLSALLSGCKNEPAVTEAAYQPSLLSADQYSFIGEVTETILPATDTPGAKAAGVPTFIDRMVGVAYEKDARDRFMNGLGQFMSDADKAQGKAFMELTPEERLAYLNEVDTRSKAQLKQWADTPPASPEEAEARYDFFTNLKELTLIGYFTSEPVGTEVLAYDPVPGVYNPCVPVSEVGATWALS